MLNRPFNTVLARLGLVAAVLATLLLLAPVASAADSSVDYAENGEDPVATFSATDPEGDAVTWKLEGDEGVDNADFEIGEDSGVLTFKDSPNFESPTDRHEDPGSAVPTGVEDNTYIVSVTANGGDAYVLAVNVTDVDEPGKVGLDKPQPQVGRVVGATGFDDPDGTDEKTVAWFSGPSATGPWTDLEVTNESYTPKAADAGNYLRVVFTYNDKFGDGKTAEAVSDMAVEDKTLANARPEFEGDDASATEDGFQVTIMLKEGTATGSNVGDPVSATDDDNDVLRYMILEETNDATPPADTTDYAKFKIDSKTGQLMVGDTKLDYEPAGSVGGSATGNPGTADQIYVVTVRVVDPSGAPADADVTIMLQDVNEPPIFDEDSDKLTTLYIAENTGDSSTVVFKDKDSIGASPVVTDDDGDDADYLAVDDDNNRDAADPDTVTYFLEGADKDKFGVDAGQLTKLVATMVDFETKSSYAISVVAKSSRDDPDDDADATIDMYDKVDVTVTVVDDDDPGEAKLSQREPQVGGSVIASVDDDDAGVTSVEWKWYRLTATDATADTVVLPDDTDVCDDGAVGTASCVIEDATSASYTVTQHDQMDDNPDTADTNEGRYLAAQVTYNDTFNEDDEKVMAVVVSDAIVQKADPANTAPEFKDQDRNIPGSQDETVTREVKENTGAEEPIGDALSAEDGDLLMYTLGGADMDSFELSDPAGNSVNLLTKAELDFETKSEYTVTVTATDPSGASDIITVTVMVIDEDEGGVIALDSSVEYAENGEDPVETFSAKDPEGDAVTWKLEGDEGVDNEDFEIDEDSGVLTFKESPNYESPTDRHEDPDSVVPTGVGDRMYKVSVTANGGKAFVLTVEVTDVDEPGEVGLDKPQPQVGRAIGATGFDDPDGTDEKTVAWFSGPSATGPWTDLEVTNESYTPKAADAGNYLRVVFTYNDKFGDGKTAEAVSDMAVEDKTLANARPEFEGDDASATEDGFQVTIMLKEGTATGSNVGDPVSATDDDNDVLRYMILEETNDATPPADTTDYAKFKIDSKTGQLMVGDTKLDYEPAGSVGGSATGNPGTADQIYVVTVRVVDPSGAPADADVTIMLQDVNEPPIFDEDSDKLTTLYIAENTGDSSTVVFKDKDSIGASPVVTDDDGDDADYLAVDDDNNRDAADPDTVTYDLEGADKGKFGIDAQGQLTKLVATMVDFETKSSYSIAVVARSSRDDPDDDADATIDMYDKVDVTVTVVDGDDLGEAKLSQREPQVGGSVIASVDDDDAGVTNVEWKWYRLIATDATADTVVLPGDTDVCDDEAVGDVSCVIEDATSASYTVTQHDQMDDNPDTADTNEGRYLAAQVTYNDTFNEDDEKVMAVVVSDAIVQKADPANTAPEFKDQDRNIPGSQDETVTREVKENTGAEEPIGDALSAEDADGDLLMYTLGGADMDSFELSDPAGNSVNLLTKAELDFETKSEYTVTVTATDPSGASDIITVAVIVTNENDGATIVLGPGVNTAPAFPSDTANRNVNENMYAGAAVGDPVEATDDDAGDTLTYELTGSTYFDIDTSTGQIMTTMMLDEEAMSSHSVTVTATDKAGETDSVAVTITVTDSQPGCDTVGDIGLVNDCEALLDSEDALGGSLNWADDTPMSDMGRRHDERRPGDGGQPEGPGPGRDDPGGTGQAQRADQPEPADNDLSGEIPGSLNRLSNLTVLNLHSNIAHG